MEPEDIPTLVGRLTKLQGIKGFEPAPIGHPVFELKDRYIIFVKSETMLVEKAADGSKKKFFYSVAIPYYKDTLEPFIDFTMTEAQRQALTQNWKDGL